MSCKAYGVCPDRSYSVDQFKRRISPAYEQSGGKFLWQGALIFRCGKTLSQISDSREFEQTSGVSVHADRPEVAALFGPTKTNTALRQRNAFFAYEAAANRRRHQLSAGPISQAIQAALKASTMPSFLADLRNG